MESILRFFGYTKIPKEAIQASLRQESLMESAIEIYEAIGKEAFADMFKRQLDGQKTLTRFLQTGRMTVR